MDLPDSTLLTSFYISHMEKGSQNKRCQNMGNTDVAGVVSGLKTPGVLLFNFLVQQDQGINSLWLCFLPLFLRAVFDLCFTCRSAIHTLKGIIYSALHRVRLNHENPFYFFFWMISKPHTHRHTRAQTHTHCLCKGLKKNERPSSRTGPGFQNLNGAAGVAEAVALTHRPGPACPF